jgi:hypothetical protein
MFEQQSAPVLHASPYTRQMPPPHLPPKQPSEQQSIALVHAASSAKQ